MSKKTLGKQASEIFKLAADYIRRYGWHEKGMSKHGQPRCSMGALESAWPKEKCNLQLPELMYDTLYSELAGETLTEFNHRTKSGEAVAKLFERTALNLANNHR